MNDFNVFVYNFDEKDIEFVRNNLLPEMKMEVVNDMSAFIGEYYFLGLINQKHENENCYSII